LEEAVFTSARVRLCLLLVFSAALLTLVSSYSAAGDGPPRSTIAFTLSVTDRDASTRTRSGFGLDLEAGQEKAGFLFQSVDCGGGGASRDETWLSARYPARDLLRWRLQARLLSTAVGQAKFELDWRRTESREGVPDSVEGGRRTITLRQGERHLLDYSPCPADSPYANLIVEVTAAPLEEPAGADLSFSSEVWLVHTSADGRKTTQKAVVVGRQSEKASFRFEPVPLPLEAGAANSPMKMEVFGYLTARAESNGTIQVALETSRKFRDPSGSGVTDVGLKALTLKPDETVEIVLPSAGGTSQWRSSTSLPKNPVPGVSVSGGLVGVDQRQFLAGSATSVFVTVHRTK
jgi:hypothetical protein